MDAKHAYVFFVTARGPAVRWRHRLVSWLVRTITVSPVCHCMIGFDGVVLDPSLAGMRYWQSTQGVIRHYPTLYALFRVPFQYDIDLDLDYFQECVGVSQPIFPRLLRLVRFGRGPKIYDCLCVALACLEAGGVPVDPHISTPAGLYRWLRKKGYPYASCAEQTGDEFRVAAQHLCLD